VKVIILAAGKGTRLGNQNEPKPLTLLENGKSILQMQIDSLTHFVAINDIIIVVGYCKEMIINLFPNAFYVYNPDYAHENTSKSLLKALCNIESDILWLNGDVVFHPSSLQKIMGSPTSCMLVNCTVVGEEEVKYRTDGHQRILEVSKSVKNAEGEALGINYFKQNDLAILKAELTACQSQDYFEKAIEGAVNQGTEVRAIPIDKNLCIEIDFYEDLVRANALLKEW